MQAHDNAISFIEELKRQWVETIDALIDPLMLVDSDYRIIRSNRAMAKVTNLDVTEVVGKTCYQIFANRKSPCENCAMHKAINDKKAKNWDLSINKRYYEVTSQPLQNSRGEVTGTVQIYHDRTETKNLQDRVIQQEKLASIGLLSSGVAHEINNPLGGILMFAQVLLQELDKNSPHYNDVVEIEAATQRCKSIVSSLLDFAKHQGAVEGDRRSSVSVVQAMQAALSFGRVTFDRDIEILEQFPEEELVVLGDRNKLIQVFLNLIQNAAHSMVHGGTMTLMAKTVVDPKDQCAYGHFSVTDSGTGIPDEHKKRIFEPFFTTKEPGTGTGLGLSVCYGIIKDLGGNLDVESHINQGSTFTVKLPLVRQKPHLKLQ